MSSKTWSDSRKPMATRSTPTTHFIEHNQQQLIQDQLHIGDRVQVNNHHGTVRFIGTTKFKAGTWAGIELDSVGSGKNDGSVDGKRYFVCPPKTGLFILAIKVIKQQQHLSLLNRPSTPHHYHQQKSKNLPSFPMEVPPPLPAKINNHDLMSRIKALEQENSELKQAASLMEKKKNERIEQLESTILQVKKASMDSIDILEDIHRQKMQQMAASLEDEKRKVRELLTEQNDLRKAGLEAIESYESTLAGFEKSKLKSRQIWDLERKKMQDEQDAMLKSHHQQVRLLLQDIDTLEMVLHDKMTKEVDLVDSLKREKQNNSLLTTELKGIKFQLKISTNFTAGSDGAAAANYHRWSIRDKLDTPIPEEEEEDNEEDLFNDSIMNICALCEQKGHDLIQCHILNNQQQRQQII
ncbi:hypothetical protein [Parasitella parasitica]|uniref:CAP-Gly domain-containing protein n=1 Tax=Parasitella parasitica TaxID=35722 RepID=A0A0B7MXN3_9FUNG|nr:hypothetical protein [Parasitella parasitica]